MIFTNTELKRYNRHIILSEIGIEGQKKLKRAKVLVVGAGGLGCPVLQYLTAAGVGTIGICDFDLVDESNLQRQILFNTNDIGKPKAVVALNKLSQLNPYINFNLHNLLLSKENVLEILKNYDLVIDGSDNFPTRFLINDACVILNKPYVFGAIYKFEGQVTVFNYKGGPTYRCLIPEQPLSNESLSCTAVGVIGVLPGIIGSYQACEAIKIITETGSILSGKLLLIDTLRMQHSLISIKRNETLANINQLGDYGEICAKPQDIKQLKPIELFNKLINKQIQIIDIREKEDYEYYHIESENIPIWQLLSDPSVIPLDKPVVFVCAHGINSRAIIEELENMGKFENLFNLEGGLQAWISENLPLIRIDHKNI